MAATYDNSNIIYGGDMMIFIATGSSDTKIPFAYSLSSEIKVNLGTRDVSSKDSGYWEETAPAKLKWSGSANGLMSLVYTGATDGTRSVTSLYNIMTSRSYIWLSFGIHTTGSTSPAWVLDTAKTYFTGKALITDISFTANDKENGTFSITIDGAGALTMG